MPSAQGNGWEMKGAESVFEELARRRFAGRKVIPGDLCEHWLWLSPACKAHWQAPSCLEDGTERETSLFWALLLGKAFPPFTGSRLSKSMPSLSPLSLAWWMKDECDTSKWNLQIADPLKSTFVNTNKTSLDTHSSAQGTQSTSSPRGGKLLPKNFCPFSELTWNWNSSPQSSPLPCLV